MKIHQFLNKFLHAASDTRHVVIHEGIKAQGTELFLSEVVTPGSEENHHRDLLKMTLGSFRIQGDILDIYVK